MIEFKHIFCPIDFSDTSARALVYATAFASWYEAQLTVLHVVPTFDEATARSVPVSEAGGVRYPYSRDEVVAEIGRSIERAGATALNARSLAQEGRATEMIVNCARALKADLLVMGTHGRGGFNRLLLGSVTEKVMRTAPCPVLTVPPSPVVTTPEPVTFKKILCPIDFSPSALKALQYALELGRQADGCLTVLHCIEYMDQEEPCEHVDVGIRAYRQRVIERARERLHAQLAQESRAWCDIEEVVAISRAYREILQRAVAFGADLIVMGAQGHGGVELMLYGSNTQNVVRRATCPVLTVHM